MKQEQTEKDKTTVDETVVDRSRQNNRQNKSTKKQMKKTRQTGMLIASFPGSSTSEQKLKTGWGLGRQLGCYMLEKQVMAYLTLKPCCPL